MSKIRSEMSKIQIFGTFYPRTVEDSVLEWARFPKRFNFVTFFAN